jgi:chemotaxis protein MotB
MSRVALQVIDDTGVVVGTPPPRGHTHQELKKLRKLREKGRRKAPPSAKKTAPARRRWRLLPVFLTVLLLGSGAVAGIYTWENYQRYVRTDAELAVAQSDLAEAQKRGAVLDSQLRALQADLVRQTENLETIQKNASEKVAESDRIVADLQAVVGNGDGEVTRDGDRLTLELVDKVLFRSGEAVLTKRGQRVLSNVGVALQKLDDKQIWVQGHTDDVPISETNQAFASNWELSASRALTVVHYLQDESGVDPRRLAAVGFGEYRPVSRKKKFKNRRIEIVLFPRDVKLER